MDEPLAGASSEQPTREPMRSANTALENVRNAELTDDQIDFVGRLSSVNMSTAEIARLIERMRARGAAGSQGSGSGNMGGEMDPHTAPPSYDAIES
jgi:hypothetical protein